MTHQEILDKAIQKAIKNGWKYWSWFAHEDATNNNAIKWDGNITVLYDHSFAKALWGEGEMYPYAKLAHDLWLEDDNAKTWQYHLQQMVIADDPIAYLQEHALNSEDNNVKEEV